MLFRVTPGQGYAPTAVIAGHCTIFGPGGTQPKSLADWMRANWPLRRHHRNCRCRRRNFPASFGPYLVHLPYTQASRTDILFVCDRPGRLANRIGTAKVHIPASA